MITAHRPAVSDALPDHVGFLYLILQVSFILDQIVQNRSIKVQLLIRPGAFDLHPAPERWTVYAIVLILEHEKKLKEAFHVIEVYCPGYGRRTSASGFRIRNYVFEIV